MSPASSTPRSAAGCEGVRGGGCEGLQGGGGRNAEMHEVRGASGAARSACLLLPVLFTLPISPSVLHALPPSLLLTNSLTHPPSPEDVEQAGAFVEEEMVQSCSPTSGAECTPPPPLHPPPQAPALSEHFVLPVALSHYLLQVVPPCLPGVC